MVRLPNLAEARKVFGEASRALELDAPHEDLRKLVIYDMTDGMRTSTNLGGSRAYVDGGLFVLRLIHLLKGFGAACCYVNVVEERHRQRENYSSIYAGLTALYPIYREYALKNKVGLRFLGDLDQRIEPQAAKGHFAESLRRLEAETQRDEEFQTCFLLNYSLDWAMKHPERFDGLPRITEVIRHTKFQLPTGMLLPPAISDYSSFVYVQQGSSSLTWSDAQLSRLVAVALRSMKLNQGTQYLKKYSSSESESIRAQREERLFMRRGSLRTTGGLRPAGSRASRGAKRVIIAGPMGPEIYEL